MQFQLDSKPILLIWRVLSFKQISASNRFNDFDILIQKDLMTGLNWFIPFLLILLFWHWTYSLNYVIQCLKEFQLHSDETLSEVSQKSKLKTVIYVKQNGKRRVKRFKKRSRKNSGNDSKEINAPN